MSAPAHRTARFGPVIRVAAGNCLEMYDFMVFGYYAGTIGETMFPLGNPFASLLLALMTFGAGFLMRPLGAVVLGAYTDHHGRRSGLLLTLGLMALGTLSLACTPGYDTIGWFAPLLVVAGRLLQGFSAGAELGGVSVYLAEIAPPGHKGFYVSWQSASQQVAVIVAALVGLVLAHRLSPEQMKSWGWRIPLLLGCLIVPLLFLLRSSLEETPEFTARRRPSASEILRSLAANWPVVLTGSLLVAMTTVSFYLITAYTPTFGEKVLGLSQKDALMIALGVGVSNFVWLPSLAALSDKVGRRPLLLICPGLALLTGYPALRWLTSEPSFERLLAVVLWLSFVYAGYNSAMVVFLTEVMPADVRTAAFSLAYSLATAIFGGFTPAICTALIRLTGDPAIPGAWLALAAAASLAATFIAGPFIRQRQMEAAAERASREPAEGSPTIHRDRFMAQ